MGCIHCGRASAAQVARRTGSEAAIDVGFTGIDIYGSVTVMYSSCRDVGADRRGQRQRVLAPYMRVLRRTTSMEARPSCMADVVIWVTDGHEQLRTTTVGMRIIVRAIAIPYLLVPIICVIRVGSTCSDLRSLQLSSLLPPRRLRDSPSRVQPSPDLFLSGVSRHC